VELVRIREIFQLMKHPRKALESLKNQ